MEELGNAMAAASEQTVVQWQSPSIVIDPEFRDLIPQLTSEELDLLEKSLIAEGCRDALSVWNDDGILRLVDGHHRLAFCEKHGIPYRIDIVDGIADRIDAKIWIIINQFARRNLSAFARAELALQLKPLLAEKARKNLKTHTVDGYQPLLNSANPAINTREELAKIAGVGHTLISETENILHKGSDLLKEAARAGTISVNAAAEIAELPVKIQDKIVKSDNKQEITGTAIKTYKQEEKRKQTKAAFESYKAPEEMDRVRKWAKLLEGKSDIDRLEKLSDGNDDLNCMPRPYDVWNFKGSHPLFGRQGYPGHVPGQLVLQTLYFFTDQGDLVVDPMAGGGTVVDACAVMNRRCLAYDSEQTVCAARPEIVQKDALAAIRELAEKPDLVFIDPPYFKMKDAQYGDNSISRMDREKYLDFFTDFARACYDAGTERVAILMMDFIDMTGHPELDIFIDEYLSRFKAAGFRVERIISTNLSTHQISGDLVNKFRASKRIGRSARNLIVFKRKAADSFK